MKVGVDYKKAWQRAMAELNKSIKFHKYYYAEVQLKEFSRTMKKVRKQCTKKKKREGIDEIKKGMVKRSSGQSSQRG